MAIKIGSEFQVNTFTPGIQEKASVASLTDGGFVIVWERVSNLPSVGSGLGFAGQRYDDNGNRVGEEFIINDEGRGIAITSLADGGFVATWRINSMGIIGEPDNIYGQRYDANGNRVGQKFQVYNNPTGFNHLSNPSMTSLADGGVVITWGDIFDGVLGQRFDANGSLIGQEFQVNTSTLNTQYDSSVASLSDGGFVITWTGQPELLDTNIYGQRYDSSGNPIDSEFLVSSSSADFDGDYDEDSSVASLTDGGFIVTWHSTAIDNSFSDIYGQRYDPNGFLGGEVFRINTSTFGDQSSPSVASLADGGFVVTWTTYPDNITLNSNIYGQEYDAHGNQVGSEFLVDANNNGTQGVSSVASLPNDKFVITWQSGVQDGSNVDIYGQIFGQGTPFVGVFEIEKLARSGFISQFSFTPIEINGLPLGTLYDETYYLSQNPDVKAAVDSGAFSNGYSHFITFGGLEGRNPSTLYNETFYLSQNPDVADAVAMGMFPSGSVHYALFGQQEGRSPSELFDEQAYRANNPDVNDAITNGGFRSGFAHYLKVGKDEGRLPNNFLYDESYYLLQNPDVAGAIAADVFVDGFAHYLQFGQTEQRNPSSLFNESQYLTLNPDVADAVNANLLTSGFEHYILSGRAEGRQL